MKNINLLYKLGESVTKFFNDYNSIVSETKCKTIHDKGIPSMSARVTHGQVAKVFDHSNLKIVSPKQVLPSLPIELAQVKAGNTLENLLNEIRQIIYSLYRTKEIIKKVCNNIMNPIKL